MYFFIDKSDFDVMLKTCSNTDIPPNPSKNAQMMILKERALLVTELTSNTPLVSSIIPEMTGLAKDKSIFKSFNGMHNKYENISKILLFPKIEIITENITTNPPIIIIVLLDSSIALESMLPKLLNVHNSLVDELYECSKILFLNLCFKRANCPNKIPIVIAESVCVINKSKPILELENIEIPHCSNYKERTRIICKTKHSFAFIFSAIIVGAQICNNFSTHRVATNKP